MEPSVYVEKNSRNTNKCIATNFGTLWEASGWSIEQIQIFPNKAIAT